MELLNTALYSLMSGDTGTGKLATLSNGGIHQLVVPEGTPFNYTVFQRVLRTPQYGFGNVSAVGHFFYQIAHYAINGANNTTISGAKAAGAMADRTIDLLTNPSLNVTGKTVLSCRFDRSIPDFSEWDGTARQFIFRKGAIFEVWLA